MKKLQKTKINGLVYLLSEPIRMIELLQYLGFNPDVITIDYNGEILMQKKWKIQYVKNNDILEILSIAGGG